MHMTFGRLGAVDRQAKMSGMEGTTATTLPATWRLPHQTAIVRVLKAIAAVIVVAELLYVMTASPGTDAHAYWSASLDHPYVHGMANTDDAYLYSPAFLQVLTPLRLLPWPLFWALWVAGMGAILVWLVGPVIAAAVLVPTAFSPVFTEIWYGNIVMPMALVLALGLRYPGLWAFMLLTKVTPGIGLVWFAVRREWRSLAIALGATALIAVGSFLLAPAAWIEWVTVLRANAAAPDPIMAHLPPLVWRLAVAATIVAVGAWFGEPRALPLAVVIALPVFWYASLSLLLVWVWQLRTRHAALLD
jgi:hypothetical protein